MSLTAKIQSLIDTANETTEAGDTTLSSAVMTLCDSYGGGSGSFSELVLPDGNVSSRLAALLAYANEVTGVDDPTLTDAIRTLCAGYVEPVPVFYDKLIGDGVAYVKTDLLPTTTGTFYAEFANVQEGCRVFYTTGSGGYFQLIAKSSGSTDCGNASSGHIIMTKGILNLPRCVAIYPPTSMSVEDMDGNRILAYTGGTRLSTSRIKLSCKNISFLYGAAGELYGFRGESSSGDLLYKLRPCTYGRKVGLWDEVKGVFYGNAKADGTLTVAND